MPIGRRIGEGNCWVDERAAEDRTSVERMWFGRARDVPRRRLVRLSDRTSAVSAKFVLASASPRRRELLARVGIHPEVRPAEIDESVRPGETPEVYARRVAQDKALAALVEIPVLAADTVVAMEDHVLGKASSEEEALAMLTRLSGRWHVVHTAVVTRARTRDLSSVLVTTDVRFRRLSEDEMRAYVATGEPMDKAGAYGIQGLGGALVAEVRGSYTNVIGLPLEETLELLERQGLR